VDGRLAVDAGAVATVLTLAEQAEVTDVLLTHSHLDHTRDLPFLLINRVPMPLRVHGIAETLESLRAHQFNREMWFEAFTTPSPEDPLLVGMAHEPGKPEEVAGFRARPFPLRHTCPCAGWLLEEGDRAVYFCGDTDDLNALAPAVLTAGPRLRAVFLETSFPDRMAEFAVLTGHLTPAGLARSVRVLPKGVPVFVTHMKPGHEDEIAREVAALGLPGVRPVRAGEVIDIA